MVKGEKKKNILDDRSYVDSSYEKEKRDKKSTKEKDEDILIGRELVSGEDFKVEIETGKMNPSKKEKENFLKKTEKSTKVTLLTKDSIEEIQSKDLKEIIKETQDIKQIVIEQLKYKERARIKLLFDLENEGLLKKNIHTHTKLIDEAPHLKVDLRSLEKKINLRMLNNIGLYHKSDQVEMENDKGDRDHFNEIFNTEASIVKDIGTDQQENKMIHIEGSIPDEDMEIYEKDGQLEYERKTYTRKNKKINKNYYKVKNHIDLFKTGSSYLEDYKGGVRNFAFSSLGLKEARQKSIFGITTFFNYHLGIKVNIFTLNFKKSFFYQFLDDLEERSIKLLGGAITVRAFCDEGVEIIDINDLIISFNGLLEPQDIESLLDEIVGGLELTLWDLPSIKLMDETKEFYFPVTRIIDNVSIIVAGDKTRMKEIDKICEYFLKYHVSIKGILIDSVKN